MASPSESRTMPNRFNGHAGRKPIHHHCKSAPMLDSGQTVPSLNEASSEMKRSWKNIRTTKDGAKTSYLQPMCFGVHAQVVQRMGGMDAGENLRTKRSIQVAEHKAITWGGHQKSLDTLVASWKYNIPRISEIGGWEPTTATPKMTAAMQPSCVKPWATLVEKARPWPHWYCNFWDYFAFSNTIEWSTFPVIIIKVIMI